ncbi:hypothetical protein ACFSTE_17035 [Aquimarina hainanensis]|uniref:Lipoprotein n=1 Tax=Aquimarina hainanensis TaxID=1578017 RepID=A0ABW5NCE7_9FLAO|nr:hypothetical protein [Aquimarina sp. TRL1]QKX06955.1 hypothetical protein HN014_19205 [Aquimarina sp. TRL1]
MKTSISSIALCLILLVAFSCKKDPKTDKVEQIETTQDTTAVAEEEVVEKKKTPKPRKVTKKKKAVKKEEKEEVKIAGVPTFTDSQAKKYVRDYEAYIANYKKAVEAHDMDSFLKLNEASSNLSRQYSQLITKLSGEDIEKLSRYVQAKSAQVAKLAEKMN